jgi:hypothetical protein
MANLQHLLKVKKIYLSRLIKQPIFFKSCSKNFDIPLVINQSSQKAIDIMKKVVNEYSKARKRSSSICTRKKREKRQEKINI